MRTLTNGTLTVQAYDASVWKQERNILRVTDTASTKCTLLWPTQNDKLAEYTLDSNHSVIIDLSDFIRAIASGVQNVYVKTTSGTKYRMVLANFRVAGLISPARLFIPELPYNNADRFRIVPPVFMYTAPAARLSIEFFGEVGGGDVMVAKKAGSELEAFFYVESGANPVGDLSEFTDLYVYLGEKLMRVLKLRKVPCDMVPACVEWVGATGARKRAVWLVRKSTTDTADQVSLLPGVGDFRTVKGRADGLTLYLEGLTVYDYWYYSDIITSSDVRVLVGEEIDPANLTGGQIDERFAVDVTTKSVTIPDGKAGEQNKLEVTIKWRKYDAVNL